jgi:hypothetical protein
LKQHLSTVLSLWESMPSLPALEACLSMSSRSMQPSPTKCKLTIWLKNDLCNAKKSLGGAPPPALNSSIDVPRPLHDVAQRCSYYRSLFSLNVSRHQLPYLDTFSPRGSSYLHSGLDDAQMCSCGLSITQSVLSSMSAFGPFPICMNSCCCSSAVATRA